MSLQHQLIDNQSFPSLRNSRNSQAANHINNSNNNSSASRFRTYLETKLGFSIQLSKKDVYNQIQNKIHLYNKNFEIGDTDEEYWSYTPDVKSPFKKFEKLYKESSSGKTQRANSTTKYNNSNEQQLKQTRIAVGKTPRSKIIQKGQEPYQLQFHDYASLVKQLPKLIHNIYYIVQQRSIVKLLRMCIKILAIAIRQQSSVLMQNTLIFFGWIYQELAEYELSLFLFEKGKSIAKYFKADIARGQSLLGIAKNLKKLSRNSDAIVFLKRGLQYLWRSKGIVAQSLQIQINQELSFNFLALGNRELSGYFRQRYEQGTLEGKNSTIIKLSNDITNAFERNLIRMEKLDENIEVFLNVDFLEIQKNLINKSYSTFEGSKGVQILNGLFKINFDIYLESVLKDNEYSDDIPLPLSRLYHILDASNQQIRQRIDSHIEKRNKMKFIPPLKIRTISSTNLGKMQKITIIKDKSIKRLAFSGSDRFGIGFDGQQSLSKNIVGRAQTKRLISKKKIESHFRAFSKNISVGIQLAK